MYGEKPLDHEPKNEEGKVLALLMKSWRLNKKIFEQVLLESPFYPHNIHGNHRMVSEYKSMIASIKEIEK